MAAKRARRSVDVFRGHPSLRRTLGPMKVHLWFRGTEPDGFHREIYAYKMWDLKWDPETPIFQGEEFKVGIGHEDTQLAVLALLEMLTLGEGDAEDAWFEEYTPRQLKWRDERADELHQQIQELQMDIDEAHAEGQPLPDVFLKKQDWSPRDDE